MGKPRQRDDRWDTLPPPPSLVPPAARRRRRARIAADGPPTVPYGSLYEMFVASVDKYGGNKCLGRSDGASFSWMTYAEVGEAVAEVGAAMAHCGVAPQGRAGVYGANSPEWMMAMQVRGAGGGGGAGRGAPAVPTHKSAPALRL